MLAIFFNLTLCVTLLPTNAALFRDTITQHDDCHLRDQKETLTHLLVFAWMRRPCCKAFPVRAMLRMATLRLKRKNVFYGFTNDFSQQLSLSVRLKIAKYYIFSASR